MLRLAALGTLVVLNAGCGIVGPSCVSQQKRGNVTTVTGQVGAAEVVVHQVRYDTQGSQNDARVSWSDDVSASGPRLTFHATKVGCTDFRLPPNGNTGDCAVIASAGRFDGGLASTLTVTHGRGNPERLGNPPEYKIWVVGDPERTANYTISITWFYGPDC